jgi:hypothetical protein
VGNGWRPVWRGRNWRLRKGYHFTVLDLAG